jgi:hypothetical protein
MFRFTIRELLILTVTAGLAVGWWLDRNHVSKDRERTRKLIAQYEQYDLDKVLKQYKIAAARGIPFGVHLPYIRETLDYYEKETAFWSDIYPPEPSRASSP